MKCQIKQMKKEIEEAKEKEQTMQILVDHLQSELGKQYVQYKEECDARKMLIWQLNDLMKCSGKEEDVTNEKTDHEDPVQLHLALKVCREDLTKAQEELTTLRAEYWDVVPRRDWDALEENHKQTLAQLKTLQGDFDLLKTEYHTLLEVQKRDKKQTSLQAPFNVKEDHASEMQSLAQSNLKDSLNPGSDMLCLQGSR
ncbi:translin-associated factor X-interacting protein 1 [Gouania willdenowi]|uniref:translin-associated factor X-interacting protein 1 n=1 Tax=Gouania willdenowi TaxID=441366 RepID=UPI00105433FB|nr:translin-associated factor X-interacting protein 1 [Gouania willdenowi]